MWLAGTRPVLCAVVAIEGNRGRGARRWPHTSAPGHPAQARDPGRVVLDAWSWTRGPGRAARTRSPDAWPQALSQESATTLSWHRCGRGPATTGFQGLQTGIAVTARGTGGQIPARPGQLSRPATW